MTPPERRARPAWGPGAATALVLAGMVAYSFAQRWSVLGASPFPLGVDGYYYPVQLRSLLETGTLAYPSAPLGLWLLAPFAALTDPITGAKLGAACWGALVAVPAYGVAARLGGGRAVGLVGAALATFSAGSMYLTIEFVKNGIGVTVALAALWLVLRALAAPARGSIAVAAAGVVAALLAHKLAAGLVLAIAVPATLAEAVGRARRRGRGLGVILAGAGLAVVAVAGVGLLAGRRVLSVHDAGLLGELFTLDPAWTLPVLARGRGLWLGHEPAIALALAVLAALALVRERPRRPGGERAAAWSLVALGLVIGCPLLAVDDAQGLGMRLRIVAFVPLAGCAAIVLGGVLARVPAHVRPRARAVGCAVLVAAIALRVPGSRTEGRVVAHPAMVAAMHALAGRIPDGGVAIVPERHLAFMAAWYARVPVALRPEAIPIERRWRLMPRAFVGADSPLYRALLDVRDRDLPAVIGLHPRDPNGLVLVPEVTWQYVLARLPAAERARFARWPTI